MLKKNMSILNRRNGRGKSNNFAPKDKNGQNTVSMNESKSIPLINSRNVFSYDHGRESTNGKMSNYQNNLSNKFKKNNMLSKFRNIEQRNHTSLNAIDTNPSLSRNHSTFDNTGQANN